jgi:hypothetical protein
MQRERESVRLAQLPCLARGNLPCSTSHVLPRRVVAVSAQAGARRGAAAGSDSSSDDGDDSSSSSSSASSSASSSGYSEEDISECLEKPSERVLRVARVLAGRDKEAAAALAGSRLTAELAALGFAVHLVGELGAGYEWPHTDAGFNTAYYSLAPPPMR